MSHNMTYKYDELILKATDTRRDEHEKGKKISVF